jgi:hypothetical protein
MTFQSRWWGRGWRNRVEGRSQHNKASSIQLLKISQKKRDKEMKGLLDRLLHIIV